MKNPIVDMNPNRFLLTSFPGAGTHQIMPSIRIGPFIDSQSNWQRVNIPRDFINSKELDKEGIEYTVKRLETFEDKIFSHLPCLPEYVETLKKFPAKILVNIRDPRDVIVSDMHKMLRFVAEGNPKKLWKDYQYTDGQRTHDKDIIHELILYSKYNWDFWLPWLDCGLDTFIVKYEDLRTQPKETIIKIVEWASPVVTLDPIPVLVKRLNPRPKNPTYRKGEIGNWRTEFTDEHKKFAEEMLRDTVERLGYTW